VSDWSKRGVHHPRHVTPADGDRRAASREVTGNYGVSEPSQRNTGRTLPDGMLETTIGEATYTTTLAQVERAL
jgi:hypothetical protein